MKRLAVWSAITFLLLSSAAVAGKPKTPKMAVQVYGVDISYDAVTAAGSYTAYLILPDGSHALASCMQLMSGPNCEIEAFVAEKRVKIPCNLPKQSSTFRECYQSESYWAERKGNEITLSTIRGNVTYHIYGSWNTEDRTPSAIQKPIEALPRPSQVATLPKNLQDVKAGMTSEAVMTGLGSSYKITKMSDLTWMVQHGDESVGIFFKDGIVTWVDEYLPVGNGDAASFVQELFKAVYPHARPATDETTNRLGYRNDNVLIWMVQQTGDMQKISFTLSDGTVYIISVVKPEKSDKPNVMLQKEWH